MPERTIHKLEELNYLEGVARYYAKKEADKEASRVLRRYRNRALIGFLILLLGIAAAFYVQSHTSHVARGVVCKIISRGDKELYLYEHEGVINRQQLARALKDSADARKLLAGEGCDTHITPPPKHVTLPPRVKRAPGAA